MMDVTLHATQKQALIVSLIRIHSQLQCVLLFEEMDSESLVSNETMGTLIMVMDVPVYEPLSKAMLVLEDLRPHQMYVQLSEEMES